MSGLSSTGRSLTEIMSRYPVEHGHIDRPTQSQFLFQVAKQAMVLPCQRVVKAQLLPRFFSTRQRHAQFDPASRAMLLNRPFEFIFKRGHHSGQADDNLTESMIDRSQFCGDASPGHAPSLRPYPVMLVIIVVAYLPMDSRNKLGIARIWVSSPHRHIDHATRTIANRRSTARSE